MLRYLPGIVLVQIVTFTLFWVNQGASIEQLLLRVGLPAVMFSAVTALWLSLIGRMDAEQRNSALREQHAEERMQLNREIERVRSEALQEASADKAQLLERAHTERERLVRQTHKEIMKQERSASRRSNLKVGLAFMGLTGFGVLMLVTQFMTLGLLTITTACGAMGGYLLRWKQSKQVMDRLAKLPENPDPRVLPAPAKHTEASTDETLSLPDSKRF
ncbi:MAG: hypothetical protein AB8B84_04095 [Granulosicoccus sp.]